MFVPYEDYLTRKQAIGLVWTNLKEVNRFNWEIEQVNLKRAAEKFEAEKAAAFCLARAREAEEMGKGKAEE